MINFKQYTGFSDIIVAFQHILAMLGAVYFIALATNMDASLVMLTSGIATVVFHFIAQREVPFLLGPSFTFIAAINSVHLPGQIGITKGAIITIGFVYFLVALCIKYYGVNKIRLLFPPVVTGPIIIVVGITLCKMASELVGYNQLDNTVDARVFSVAIITAITMIYLFIMSKGKFRLYTIIIPVIIGWISSTFILGKVNIFWGDDAKWFGFSERAIDSLITRPVFDFNSMFVFSVVSLLLLVEHIGEVAASSAVTNKDFFKHPGLHRTILGDGVASIISGFLGGPPKTPYSENTCFLAVSGVLKPTVILTAGVMLIIFSFFGKFSGLLQTVPEPVMGAIQFVLYGIIISIGIRTLIRSRVDFSLNRNIVICSLIIMIGLTIPEIHITENFEVKGLVLATIVGVVLNLILPDFE